MALFTLAEVARATKGCLVSGRAQAVNKPVRRVWTDSRTSRPGDLFVALTGDRFDGHQFLGDAFKKGAVAALVRVGSSGYDRSTAMDPVIEVEDTLRAFQDLAAHHRRRFVIPVVAVSGSNGKTTTKEMIGRVLSERFKTLVTSANYNNQIGVPQTLLGLTTHHRAAVIEMGISGFGEMTRLCEIAAPTHGVLTNIGPTHLATLGNIEGVARAKGELLQALPPTGTAILNADDAFFHLLARWVKGPLLSFGFGAQAQVRAVRVQVEGPASSSVSVVTPGRKDPFSLRLKIAGRHNIANALAAIAVGTALGIGVAAIRDGLGRYRSTAMRSELRRWRGVTILNDCYNANPASLRAALQWLAEAKATSRGFAVLGDMLELGPEAAEMHREIGREIPSFADYLLTVGTLGAEIAAGALAAGMKPDHVIPATAHDELAERLRTLARKGDVVLLKGSRGARMERVLEEL